ncbi:MAG: hypothetical protein ACKVS9_07865 [Phycisphaerae bacterium]
MDFTDLNKWLRAECAGGEGFDSICRMGRMQNRGIRIVGVATDSGFAPSVMRERGFLALARDDLACASGSDWT